jgi:PHD/YefM family antitoxin component YafN of YafNO toxin-antitoxin module
MNSFHEQYVVDEHGNRSAVLLPLADWQRVLEDLEELDDAREYDEAKRRPSEPVAFDRAVKEIRQGAVS